MDRAMGVGKYSIVSESVSCAARDIMLIVPSVKYLILIRIRRIDYYCIIASLGIIR